MNLHFFQFFFFKLISVMIREILYNILIIICLIMFILAEFKIWFIFQGILNPHFFQFNYQKYQKFSSLSFYSATYFFYFTNFAVEIKIILSFCAFYIFKKHFFIKVFYYLFNQENKFINQFFLFYKIYIKLVSFISYMLIFNKLNNFSIIIVIFLIM